MSAAIERRLNELVKIAVDGNGQFYQIHNEPIPTKTCFDVTFKTYSTPSTNYVATVKIPNNYPFAPPIIELKDDRKKEKVKFKFLAKNMWQPCMSIREALIEASHSLSRRDLKPKRPNISMLIPKIPKS